MQPLPIARVRKIMKEHRDGRFAEEAVTLMTVATVRTLTVRHI